MGNPTSHPWLCTFLSPWQSQPLLCSSASRFVQMQQTNKSFPPKINRIWADHSYLLIIIIADFFFWSLHLSAEVYTGESCPISGVGWKDETVLEADITPSAVVTEMRFAAQDAGDRVWSCTNTAWLDTSLLCWMNEWINALTWVHSTRTCTNYACSPRDTVHVYVHVQCMHLF